MQMDVFAVVSAVAYFKTFAIILFQDQFHSFKRNICMYFMNLFLCV